MPQTDNITIFSTGIGVIEPTEKFTAQEVATAIEESQKPIEHPAVVCFDERRSINGAEPVREKVGGGNLSTFVSATAAIKWSGFSKEDVDGGPDKMVVTAANFLVDSGETLGAHKHAHEPANANNEKDTGGCGANDKGDEADRAAEHAMDEEWIKHAKVDLGDLFNEGLWQQASDGYKQLANDTKWQKWERGKSIQAQVRAKDGVLEVLDADSDAFADSNDTSAAHRHGHWAQALKVNSQAGISNDRDNSRVPFFQLDVNPIIRMATKAASNEEEFSLLVHAMVMRQYAIAFVLTKNIPVYR